MNDQEFRYLQTDEARAAIEAYLHEDPQQLALKGVPAAVCTQVKYLQRSRTKLPEYYQARCIIPPVSFEQASSQASRRSREQYGGTLCLDLTCGLGADSLNFSRQFDRVIAIEADPLLARIARYNFHLLGADNITVVEDRAEHFVATYAADKADLIFVDPARRLGSRKVVLLEDCSPDIITLLPELGRHSEKIVVKTSPLFDTDEALRLFPDCCAEVVSVDNECRELLLEFGSSEKKGTLLLTLIQTGGDLFRYRFSLTDRGAPVTETLSDYSYLYIPDAAFYKARMLGALTHHYGLQKATYSGENGVILSQKPLPCFPGTGYRIVEALPYRPKILRSYLKKEEIRSADLLRRNFPYATDVITKALGIREGGAQRLLFTQAGKGRWMLRLQIIN